MVSMVRFIVVVISALIIAPGVIAGRMGLAGPICLALPVIALSVGLLDGAIYFFIALSGNRGIADVRLARDPDRPVDPNVGISMGIGAAGIACFAAANPNFPSGYRNFYDACAVIGLLIALVYAWRWRRGSAAS